MKSDGRAKGYRKESIREFKKEPKKESKKPGHKYGRGNRHAGAAVSLYTSEGESSNSIIGPHGKKMEGIDNWMPLMETRRAKAANPRKPPTSRYSAMSSPELVVERKNMAMLARRHRPIPNIFYFNPYQDYDYIVLQDMYMNTIAGRIVDLYVNFMFGNKGISPILKLNKPSGDAEKDNILITKHSYVIDELNAIDKHLEKRKNRLTYSTQTKFKALVKRSMIYGRAMLAFDYVEDPELSFYDNNKEFPNVLKSIHPRDMGLIRQDSESWDLTGITIRWFSTIYEPEDMIYLEHEPESAIFRGGFYGMSFMQSMIGSSRTLRTLLDRVMPQYAKTNWASRAIAIFKKKGTAEDDPNEELADIVSSIATGEIGVFIEDDPHDDVAIHNLDVTPDMDKLVTAIEFHVKYIMAQAGVPQALLYDEGSINMATLIGKMREFADQVHSKQLWAAEQIALQYYQRNFERKYKPDSEEQKLFHIGGEFDKIKVDSWQDSVKALRHLRAILGISDKAAGELVGIDDIESKIDPDKEIESDGNSKNKLSLGTTADTGT